MSTDLELALRLADAADSVTMERFRAANLQVDRKLDASPVTDADTRTERALRDILERERPGHAVVGEEFGETGDASLRWYLDPIDGTVNYARGVPVWATLIALRDAGEPLCAVVSAPALRRRWWAARDEGAFADGLRLHVSSVAALEDAYLSTTDRRDLAPRGFEAGYIDVEARCLTVRALGDFWGHMLVAEGAIDVAVDPVAAPWDLAPIQLIVEEAGGRFSDLTGRRVIDGGHALSTNGALHDRVVRMLAPAG
ncbi:MAG: histidinol-phosphatase [Candidatus Dormibacteraeota bacterium]|nr:histidinol-phosphatase [Candidatus Dormibacteraeota bacterium]